MKLIRKIGLVIFSVAFWIIAGIWTALLALLTIILLPIFPYKKTHSYVAAPGFVKCLQMTLAKINVTYDPAFDRNRPSVFCMNHTNLLDAHAASVAIPHAFCGLMNAWQFYIPFYGWLMWLSRGIPVKRKSKNILAEITAHAKQRREEGFSILVFPEAHRTRDGKVQKFHKGVFQMARDAGYPVVPLAVRGTYKINHRGSYLFRPGQTIDIHVGPQTETAGVDDLKIAEIARQFQTKISGFISKFNDIDAK